MAVVFDATSEVNDGGIAGTSLSLTTLTVGTGANRALVACVMFNIVPTAITLTWDSGGTNQAMTAITGASTSSGGVSLISWYGLVNPVSGNKTLKASWTSSAQSLLGAVSYSGVDQRGGTNSFPHGNAGSGTSTTPSISITSATDNAAVASFTGANGTSFTTPNQTQTWQDNANSVTSLGQRAAGAASVSFTGTQSKSKLWTAAGTDILAAVGLAGAQRTELPPTRLIDRYGRSADLGTWIETGPPPTTFPSPAPAPRGAYYALPYATPPPRLMDLQTWIETPQITPPAPPVTPPPGQILDDLPTPLSPPRPDETWVGFYNLNLIGQDQLPTGERATSLPPPGYPRIEQTWIETPPPTVTLPAGEQIFDLSPRGYPRPDETWIDFYNVNLIGQDQLPIGEQATGLWPIPSPRQDQQRAWAWWYNLNLIGRDKLPAGDQIYDLAPKGYPRPEFTWVQRLNLEAFEQLPIGEQAFELAPRPYPPAGPTWTWWYDLNLVGKDQLPVGEIATALPQVLNWYRDWSLNLQETTLAPVLQPAGEQLTERPPPLQWYRDWSLNLQETTLATVTVALPAGEQTYDVPPRGALRQDETWVGFYNLNLIGQDLMPARVGISDPPPAPLRIDETWIFTFQPTVTLPIGEQVYDLSPRGYPRPDETWVSFYNVNLIGQDRLPTGEQITDRPPPLQWYRSWELSPQIVSAAKLLAGAQSYDLPRGSPPPVQSWTARYLLTLIGKDVVPGKRSLDLPPRGFAPLVPSWTASFDLNLIGRDRLPVGKQVVNLPPPPLGTPAQTWISTAPLPFVTPVVVTTIHYRQTHMSFGIMGAMIHY